jgi:hypothetical protein
MRIYGFASLGTAFHSLTHERICEEDTVCSSWVRIKVRMMSSKGGFLHLLLNTPLKTLRCTWLVSALLLAHTSYQGADVCVQPLYI